MCNDIKFSPKGFDKGSAWQISNQLGHQITLKILGKSKSVDIKMHQTLLNYWNLFAPKLDNKIRI